MAPIDTCIYHANCADGFGAAWAIRHALKDPGSVRFIAAQYGDEAPACDGEDVLLVDFSYKREPMTELASRAASVTVLDHHATAQTELAPLFETGALAGKIDMAASGAILAWQWAHPGMNPPDVLRYVQDRDLWHHELWRTKEVNIALSSYPKKWATWDELCLNRSIDSIATEGRPILRYHNQLVRAVTQLAREQYIGKHLVPAVNGPPALSSDVGNVLAERVPDLFAAVYWYGKSGLRTYSLRSVGDFDVGRFAAEHFGGGGHARAAGFSLKTERGP